MRKKENITIIQSFPIKADNSLNELKQQACCQLLNEQVNDAHLLLDSFPLKRYFTLLLCQPGIKDCFHFLKDKWLIRKLRRVYH